MLKKTFLNMNKLIFSTIVLLLSILTSEKAVSQVNIYDPITIVVNDICLISTNTSPGPVNLTLSTSVAGSTVRPVSSSNMFLKITSIAPIGTSRVITAIVSNGTIPQGTLLKLVAAPCTSINSRGTLGNAIATPIVLSKTVNQTIIDGIGSCYTGTAFNDGYQLTFTWQPDITKYNQISATLDATTLYISFTIASSN